MTNENVRGMPAQVNNNRWPQQGREKEGEEGKRLLWEEKDGSSYSSNSFRDAMSGYEKVFPERQKDKQKMQNSPQSPCKVEGIMVK